MKGRRKPKGGGSWRWEAGRAKGVIAIVFKTRTVGF